MRDADTVMSYNKLLFQVDDYKNYFQSGKLFWGENEKVWIFFIFLLSFEFNILGWCCPNCFLSVQVEPLNKKN